MMEFRETAVAVPAAGAAGSPSMGTSARGSVHRRDLLLNVLVGLCCLLWGMVLVGWACALIRRGDPGATILSLVGSASWVPWQTALLYYVSFLLGGIGCVVKPPLRIFLPALCALVLPDLLWRVDAMPQGHLLNSRVLVAIGILHDGGRAAILGSLVCVLGSAIRIWKVYQLPDSVRSRSRNGAGL